MIGYMIANENRFCQCSGGTMGPGGKNIDVPIEVFELCWCLRIIITGNNVTNVYI